MHIDEDDEKAPPRASVIDALALATFIPGRTKRDARKVASRSIKNIIKAHPNLSSEIRQVQINGVGRLEPVAEAATLVELIMLCPGAGKFRRKAAEYICRILGGDVTLIPEIEAQNEAIGGTDLQQFLLAGITPKRMELRDKARHGTKRKAQAIHDNASGMTKSELGRKLDITKKQKLWTARDYFTEAQISLVSNAEIADARIFANYAADPEEAEQKHQRFMRLTRMMAEEMGDDGKFAEPCTLKQLDAPPPAVPAIEAPPTSVGPATVNHITNYYMK